MTTSEPGPELDRRVAEAMGKGPVFVYDCYPCHEVFAAYSTDPARIAEMVEWLTERTGSGIEHGVNIDWKGSCYREGAYVQRNGGLMEPAATGKTIQYALALLVVAVGDE